MAPTEGGVAKPGRRWGCRRGGRYPWQMSETTRQTTTTICCWVVVQCSCLLFRCRLLINVVCDTSNLTINKQKCQLVQQVINDSKHKHKHGCVSPAAIHAGRADLMSLLTAYSASSWQLAQSVVRVSCITSVGDNSHQGCQHSTRTQEPQGTKDNSINEHTNYAEQSAR